jgi:flagellar FliL protein
MSEAPDTAPKKKGGKLKKIIMLGGGAVLMMGAGAGAGIYASGGGAAGHAEEKPKEDPHAPKLVKREGVDDIGHAPPGHGGEAEGEDGQPDMSQYKATYYPIEQNFTSNLRDSDGFAQVGLGVSTYYDEKLIEHIKENEMPIRSAVLMTLANEDAMVISTPEGKEKLQQQLKAAINKVLKEKTGFGGVDSVYFTSFIIQ